MRCLAGVGLLLGGDMRTYQGAPIGPLEIPLDGPVVQADPLVLSVLVWGGHGGCWVGGRKHSQGPCQEGGSRELEAEFEEIWGLGVSGGEVGGGWPGEGDRALCPCLSLPVPDCPCLSLSVPACPCLSLPVPASPCLSLPVPGCP